jgi:HTH-type transcriptional regulator / antitoxin HigA
MDIVPIKAQRDYRRVLEEIESLMMARRNTAEGERICFVWSDGETWDVQIVDYH